MYLGLARAHVGQERRGFAEACRAVPHSAREKRLAAGLRKLVTDRCVFEEDAPDDPAELRDSLFAAAAAARRDNVTHGMFSRQRLLAEFAAARGIGPDAIERGLFADLPDAHRMVSSAPMLPETLLAAYEDGQAQAVLLRAVRVQTCVRDATPAAYRALFRKLKFLRLLHRIEPLPPTPGDKDSPGYLIDIDGPFSLFDSVTKYGLQLALALPALRSCGSFSLTADLRWGAERTPLKFQIAGRSAEGTGIGNDDALPDDVAALLTDLRAASGPWQPRVATKLLNLPGLGVCVPDLELRHRDSGKSVHLEALGFWSRDAVWKRIEFAMRGLGTPMIFAVSKHLRVSEAVLPDDLPAALYVYARVMNARAILERADAVAARG